MWLDMMDSISDRGTSWSAWVRIGTFALGGVGGLGTISEGNDFFMLLISFFDKYGYLCSRVIIDRDCNSNVLIVFFSAWCVEFNGRGVSFFGSLVCCVSIICVS